MGSADGTPLFERVAAGDAAAQGLFWRRKWDGVCASCARVLGESPSSDEARDLAASVLSDFIFVYAPRITRPGAADAYLQLMATRRAIKARDRRRRRRESEIEGEEERLIDQDAPSLDGAAFAKAMMPRIEACLGELTPKAQQTLLLRYSGDLTNDAIGALVGGSKQYIGRLITQSIRALRECMQRSGVRTPAVGVLP